MKIKLSEFNEEFWCMSDDERMRLVVEMFPTIGRTGLAKKADVGEKRARTFLSKIDNKVSPQKNSNREHLVEQLVNSKLTERELNIIIESTKSVTKEASPAKPKFVGRFKALVMSDTHIGHKCFNQDWYYSMIDHAVKEECDWAWHVGDILEGMSGRPGHVYELEAIGFEAQFQMAVDLFNQCPFPIRGITGNHDLWYAGKGDIGLNIGMRLQSALPDKFFFLGNEEADEIVNGIKVKLWHGRDGSSYAVSYRCQKFIESLSGGEKPHILLSGHAHKSAFFECRNVQVIEAGTLSEQTGFMRGKKLAAHTGYWIIEVWTDELGLERIKTEWVPFLTRQKR